jgi:hypothetical protein
MDLILSLMPKEDTGDEEMSMSEIIQNTSSHFRWCCSLGSSREERY